VGRDKRTSRRCISVHIARPVKFHESLQAASARGPIPSAPETIASTLAYMVPGQTLAVIVPEDHSPKLWFIKRSFGASAIGQQSPSASDASSVQRISAVG